MRRILDATETLLAKRRFEDISIGDIVRASKSSVGAFYARFPDKDALLGCLYERFRQEQAKLTDALFDPALAERVAGRSVGHGDSLSGRSASSAAGAVAGVCRQGLLGRAFSQSVATSAAIMRHGG